MSVFVRRESALSVSLGWRAKLQLMLSGVGSGRTDGVRYRQECIYCARTGLRLVCIQKEGIGQYSMWLFLLMVVICLASFLAPWVPLGNIFFPIRVVSARIILGVIFIFVFLIMLMYVVVPCTILSAVIG
jgi:hypothetical protein